MSKERTIVYSDGTHGTTGNFPAAVVKNHGAPPESSSIRVVDPVLNIDLVNNLYGRMMTLLEATTDKERLSSVKSVFGKEIKQWESDVYESAVGIASGDISSRNLYK